MCYQCIIDYKLKLKYITITKSYIKRDFLFNKRKIWLFCDFEMLFFLSIHAKIGMDLVFCIFLSIPLQDCGSSYAFISLFGYLILSEKPACNPSPCGACWTNSMQYKLHSVSTLCFPGLELIKHCCEFTFSSHTSKGKFQRHLAWQKLIHRN